MRAGFLASLNEQAAALAVWGGTPLPLAMQCTVSEANEFFASQAFADGRKQEDGRVKLALASISRGDGIIKALGNLGKLLHAMSKRPSL